MMDEIHFLQEDLSKALQRVKELSDRVSELEEEALFLQALEASGVENWVGYESAIEYYAFVKKELEGN